MATHYWLSEEQFRRLQPLLPNKVRGVPRVDDRRVISGILHVLQSGCRWRDAPAVYGPYKTLYNRFVRWARKGVWEQVFRELAAAGGAAHGADVGFDARQGASVGRRRQRGAYQQAIGRSRGGRTTKLHAAVDGAGRPRRLLVRPGHRGDVLVGAALVAEMTPWRCLADTAYDSDALRAWLWRRGCQPVIPNNPTRKHKHPFDPVAYKERNVIERTFCRLKDWRRIATSAMTNSPRTTWPPSPSPLSLCIGYESRP